MMSAGGCEQVTTDDDSMKFVDSLLEMKLRDTALDQQATNDLAEQCLAKFDDLEAALECRAISLYTVLAQIRAGNVSMLAHVPDICQRLKSRSVLTQPVADAGAEDFHRHIIDAISVILDLSPVKLVDEFFGPVMQYLVQLVSCKHVEIAILACKFWAKYAGMPSNITIRKHWMSRLVPEMSSLITALMDQMIYHPAYAEHLEQFDLHCLNSAGEQSLPSDVESFANLRNLAAVAFEHVAHVYPTELVCATFRPLLEKRIESSWSEKEAAILALAAFTQGAGTPDAMSDSYALLVPHVVDCYADPHPLLRSIACLTMPKLVGQRLRGVKDPWSRVLTCTAKATRDSCAEVRRTAIRALSTLLAYGTPSGGTRRSSGVGGHTARLVDALVRADQYDMDSDTRCVYFECVSHLVGRTSDSLTADDMDRLMPPLIGAWKSQQWNHTADAEKTGSIIDPDLGIVSFSVALGTIATYGKSLYAPFAECVFEKACIDIEEIVKSVAPRSKESEQNTGKLSPAMTSHIISCLDLLSANYDGLAAAAAQYAAKFHLLEHLYATLNAVSLDERIYQSALALLGHVLIYETGPTEPVVDVFLDVIRSRLEAPDTARKTRGNALWALVHAVANQSASEERLLGFVDRLVAIFKQTDDEPTCIINAAWALTSICAPRATNTTITHVITRRDVFLHLSGLLRAQFPRALEKLAIFTNVCRMLAPVISKIPVELWSVFLSAVVADDQVTLSNEVGADDLYASLRSLLRDVRSTLGSASWTRALQELGPNRSSVLRRRFKLY